MKHLIPRWTLAMALLMTTTLQSFPCLAQSAVSVVRSGLVPAAPDDRARLSVINTADMHSASTIRVGLRIHVWGETIDRGLVAHWLRDTISSGIVTLAPGQGVSLDYANEACDKRGECNSVSAIVEFPDGLDLRAKPSFQLIDARKGRVLITVLHDASGP